MTNKILLLIIVAAAILLYPALNAFTTQSTTQTTTKVPYLQSADAAFDAFLKIDGIQGEVLDEAHRGEIAIDSYSWGMSQAGINQLGGGGDAGKVSFNDFSIVKALDKASPKLALACANGEYIKEIQLTLARATGDKQPYMIYKLEDVIVTTVNQGGNANGDANKPMESVSFSYGKITWTYIPQKPDGSPDSPVSAGWNLKNNKGT